MASTSDSGFGDLLRSRRRASGLTQEELAARAGLSARGIADLERGARHTPRRETVALLAEALGLADEDRATFVATARHYPAAVAPMDLKSGGEDESSLAPVATARGEPPQGAIRTAGVRHNLSIQPTRMLGRDEALRTMLTLFHRPDVRLVTLTGPGGVGKTRLALEVAAAVLGDFADGVWFVRLSRLSDPALVVPAIAQTLGLKETGEQPTAEILRAHLRDRSVLLVLDNCEHVAASAPDVAELLETCSGLRVLATSRMRLRLRAEHVVLVVPLELPPTSATPADLAHNAAVELFVDRAQATRPDFALTEANAAAVAGICTRLDGLPLAIELAASRVKLLPPSALLARLEGHQGVLAGGARDLDERQQTMSATLDWSEGLLASEERALFRRLAVFAGGCTLEAAEAVCVAPTGADPLRLDVLDGLSALVDLNLVQQREEGGEARFGMLHVVREYAMGRLATSGEVEHLRRAHLAWLVALGERAEPNMVGPGADMWLDQLDRESDNLRAALGWVQARGDPAAGLRLVAAVFRFWVLRGHLREGRAWAGRLLALDTGERVCSDDGMLHPSSASSGKVRARALRAAGVLALYQADEGAAAVWLEQAVTLGRAAGDAHTAALALNSLGVTAMHRGDLARARAQLEECLALLRTVGDLRGIASALVNVGLVAYFTGDLERAAAEETEALAVARELGDRDYAATALANLASVALRRNEVEQSEALGREALALYHDLGDPRRCAVGLEGLASSASLAGDWERAARLLGAAEALREALGTPIAAHERVELEQTTAPARAALGEECWAADLAAGRALTLEEALAEALGDQPPTAPAPPGAVAVPRHHSRSARSTT